MSSLTQLKIYAKELTLLYVESDLQVRDEIYKFLNRFFSHVDLAANGEEGLQYYDKNRYDIIITDIKIADINGIELAKAIKERNPDQSIIVLSAYNESEHLLELINIGIEHYVLKPINIKQFAKALKHSASQRYNQNLFRNYHQKIEEENEHLSHEIEKMIHKLKNQYEIDSLTGLKNLTALMQDIDTFNKEQHYFAVIILLDIKRFNFINDLYGTASGNEVLIKVADFLNGYAKERNYRLYRLSADKFVLFEQMPYLDTDKYDEDLDLLTLQLKKLSIYLEAFEKEINVDMTIGMSLGQEYPLEHADMALNYAKKNNKNFAVYNTLLDTTDEIKVEFEWQQKIDTAITEDDVIPVYQPIVDSDGNIIKYETLMRVAEIVGDTKRLISPVHFLDRAIENRQYETLSRLVIKKALNELAANDYTISINLTMDDIKNKSFLQEIYNTIKEDGTARQLVFEITESQSADNYKLMKKFIAQFKQLGIRFAIDDFGSGFSNFEHVLEIQPDYIKIDGSLVKDIDTNARTNILTTAITRFSHELGIKVIAEYVHSEAIFQMLKQIGVDEFQGYYFSEPLITI